eukprot:TRINITY_DN13505_c0_g1_i1.p1 TRINITY_DN13505_c0_g1~~TRINITY_DN13505_c0_g1_i1.p1  ORF type:complete len:450 (+),score=58.97 TRINITY_DN13505_c0_g1_i1:184-1350(+)
MFAVLIFLIIICAEDIRQLAIRTSRIAGQSQFLLDFRVAASNGKQQQKAEMYFKEMYPKVLQSASTFPLHWYFRHTKPPPHNETLTWYEIVGLRTVAMAKLLKEHGRDDFRIEKDRCEMYRFFKRNNIPHANVLGNWSPDQSVEDIISTGVLKSVTRWPAFFKACHLTQGSMKATFAVESEQWAISNTNQVQSWVTSKLTRFADDWERPWRSEGNSLTDTLKPGLMLQDGWHKTYNPYKEKSMAIEIKVEVVWGVAYLGVCSDLHSSTQFLRDGSVEMYPTMWSKVFLEPQKEDKMTWMPSHLPCVWNLAEKVARIIQCECVRIDIFLWEGHPDGCVVNELSISSGMDYALHFKYLTRAWSEPLFHKMYPPTNDTEKVRPVYMNVDPL